MKKIFSLLALIAVSANISAPGLSGSVKSASGEPLPRVLIFPTRSLKDITETDDRGNFFLPRFETIIAFRRAGSRPVTKIVDPSITRLDIVLEDAAATVWSLPRCNENDKRTSVGFTLRMRVPKEATVRKGSDIDYESFSIGYGPKSKRVWLHGIKGVFGSLGIPPYDWILNATEFSERPYKVGDLEGGDMRGRLRDGTYWRYVGRLTEEVEYHGLTHEQAAFFDRIIDGACSN